MLNQFGKDYKLCSKTVITRVFKEGSLIKRKDVLFRYLVIDAESENKIQFMTSAPKKKFRMAVDRNYVKRILREMIRKNKHIIELNENKSIYVVVNYLGALPIIHKELELQILDGFSLLLNQIQNNKK
tara:strand:+ start:1399 stop:1782 length:384 start_codon:yes stop_codon:yes gene_type:complete